jgi:hypothetical protein
VAEPAAIVVSSPETSFVVTESESRSSVQTVGTPGQRGPRGLKGDRGDTGSSAYEVWLDEGNVGTEEEFLFSLIGGQFTYDQMVPESVWVITHNLGFFPNVMTFDSAGSQVIGDVNHINQNSMTITFSGSNAGKAHLS